MHEANLGCVFASWAAMHDPQKKTRDVTDCRVAMIVTTLTTTSKTADANASYRPEKRLVRGHRLGESLRWWQSMRYGCRGGNLGAQRENSSAPVA